MILFLIIRIYSLSLFAMTMFRTSTRDGINFFLSMTWIPPEHVLESLYKLRICESDQLKTVLELYDMEIHQKKSMPNYQKLKTMVKRNIDRKLRLRNFDGRNEKIETGAVVTSRRGLSGIERGKGFSKAKMSVFERRPNAVSDTRVMDRANRHQKPLPSSEPPTPRSRSGVEKKEPQRQKPV